MFNLKLWRPAIIEELFQLLVIEAQWIYQLSYSNLLGMFNLNDSKLVVNVKLCWQTIDELIQIKSSNN